MRNLGKNAAIVIKEARMKMNPKVSQQDLSILLGFKSGSGQFISNVERGLCGFPPKLVPKICSALNLDEEILLEAMMKDYGDAIKEEVTKISEKRNENANATNC